MNIAIEAVKAIVIAVMILSLIPILIWFERKGCAYIQDRRGPNRAQILGVRLGGIIHNIADVLKLITKEDIVVAKANRFFYILAPMITMFVAIGAVGVIPFAEPLQIGDFLLKFQIADLNVGLLYILAISSLSIYGVMLAGWSSNNNYSLLGGLRASAQMISYEISMGLAIVGLLIGTGTVLLPEIISMQSGPIWNWFCIKYPLAFIIFIVALFAEANRTPFDLPEGESELVAGFHSEYSSMKFALFFMGEYAHMAVGSAFLASLFFGGWNLPWVTGEMMQTNMALILNYTLPCVGALLILAALLLLKRFKRGRYGDLRDFEVLYFGLLFLLLGLAAILFGMFQLPTLTITPFAAAVIVRIVEVTVFMGKLLFFTFFFVWIRWTLPRFRYDQLMKLGWQIMVPLALLNIFIIGLLQIM